MVVDGDDRLLMDDFSANTDSHRTEFSFSGVGFFALVPSPWKGLLM